MNDPAKSKKLKRLVTVQRQIEKMAENELSAAIAERTQVAENMNRTAGFMTSLEPLHRPFSRFYIEQFSRLAARDQRLSLIQQAQETRVAKERAKGDKLEEKMKDAVEAEKRAADDNGVYDLLDMIVTLKHTSFQQG